jgi:Cytochrome P460
MKLKLKSRFGPIALASLGAVLATSLATGADKPAATFEGKDTLLRPEGYREWVFVGSSLGLRYDQNSEKSAASGTNRFNNVYLNPTAYREFSKTGKFPDGTVLVLEIASAEAKKEPGLQGSFQKEFVALEAAVKDSRRFEGGWAYFSFDDKSGKPKDKARPFPNASCYNCHHQKAATDHVFTQFYPVLRTNSGK